jgi:DNA polymerase V
MDDAAPMRNMWDARDDYDSRHKCRSVVLASSSWAKARSWSTKFDMRSPRYTTRIDELPMVR